MGFHMSHYYISCMQVAEVVQAAKQQGLDPMRMLAEAMAMGE